MSFAFADRHVNTLWRIFEDVLANSEAVLAHKMNYDAVLPYLHSNAGGKLTDYVRVRSLQLVAQEIVQNGVTGSVAEAGVWRGYFSSLINSLFPERKLYLFDTFEGFSKEQIQKEYADGAIDKGFVQEGRFGNTSEDLVMSAMPHRENVIIKKGLFEETSATVDDTFAFVSLDMDIYAPMFFALDYFYPRMTPGGYIFMHDYNHKDIRGVKKAVSDYEEKQQCRLHKMPLPDEGGSVVIIKGSHPMREREREREQASPDERAGTPDQREPESTGRLTRAHDSRPIREVI